MNTFEHDLRDCVDRFYADLIPLLRQDILNRLAGVGLSAVPAPALPRLPRREPRRALALPAAHPSMTEAEKRVFSALSGCSTPVTSGALAPKVGRGETTVRYLLMKLVRKGLVRRTIDGKQVRYTDI